MLCNRKPGGYEHDVSVRYNFATHVFGDLDQLAVMEPTFVAESYRLGQQVLDQRSGQERKRHGQFLTTVEVARFMARLLGGLPEDARVLDPAIGSGVLASAVVEHAIQKGYPCRLSIDGYETDPQLACVAEHCLALAAEVAAQHDIRVDFKVRTEDFLLSRVPLQQAFLFADGQGPDWPGGDLYDGIIANPPYFKLSKDDRRVTALAGTYTGHTNIYTLFMAVATDLIDDGGTACFIVPRSFCSGAYFASFRKEFVAAVEPRRIHLFVSRQETFKEDGVLQENLILTFRRRRANSRGVALSVSKGSDSLGQRLLVRHLDDKYFVARQSGTYFLRLPTTDLDQELVGAIDKWPKSLHKLGLAVSTGPVVAFRSEFELLDAPSVARDEAVPLLWMHHVRPHTIEWPVESRNKAQGISKSSQLLVPLRNYVLLRRFSAKEEKRRIIAAPLLKDLFGYSHIGIENHINYIYKRNGELSKEEAIGLAVLLNSSVIDRYVRITNGNTQINALELRTLPLPPWSVIQNLGRLLIATENESENDRLVLNELQRSNLLPPDFPLFEETRFDMGKIQESQDVLKTLGLPRLQQNEMSALTLLVLAGISEDTNWADAHHRALRIHDILTEIKALYGREYAENTRETIRRQVIHQFIQAGLAVRNPDKPSLPTNSPRTHYTLHDPLLDTIRTYGTPFWDQAARSFLENQRALIETYRRVREQHKIPLHLSDGSEYHLSPGAHSELQAAIVEEFGPRFSAGAHVLYVGDTADKMLHIDLKLFADLHIPVSSHDKLPDVVLLDEARLRLLLIEAVTSHGPISPKRRLELEEMLAECPVQPVFVTAFPDFSIFKEFLLDIAWETEVWIASNPSHLIHFNGDRFLSSGRFATEEEIRGRIGSG